MFQPAVTLSAVCLALVLPPTAGFFSAICSGCTCTEGSPFVIDCSDRNFESTYTSSSDTWPSNHSDIKLSYDRNSLTKVEVVPTQNFTILSFKHNDIANITDGAFTALTRLVQLDLSHNKLTRDSISAKAFRGQFSGTDYQPSPIQQLDLSYNSIHSIFEDAMSHFSSLTELNLSGNPLSLLDHHTILALTSLPRLGTLGLAGTGLSKLPHGLLHSLITLRHLDLGDNQLTEVPPELHNSHAIQTLTMDKNPIKDINEGSFRGMVKLEVLSISEMPELEYITDDSFSTLVALNTLMCRNNRRLWSISSSIFRGLDTSPGIFPLSELMLSGNNLTTLEETTVPYWDQLLLLQIHGNPWRCDCRLQWMVDSLLPQMTEKDEGQDAKKVACASPKALAGVPVQDASKTSGGPLPCPVAPHHSFGNSGSSTTLAAALTIGAVVIASSFCVVLFLFWRRNSIRRAYRAKQQIRYRRAAMEEVGAEDTASVST